MFACYAVPVYAGSDLKVGTGTVEIVATDEMTIAGGIGGGKAMGQEGRLRAVAVVPRNRPPASSPLFACDILFVTDAMVQAAAARIEPVRDSGRPLAGQCHAHALRSQHGAHSRLWAGAGVRAERR